MPDDKEATIQYAIDDVVHKAGPNPATTCLVRVNTHIDDCEDDEGEEDVWATVTFDAILPNGREIELEKHFVENVDELNLEALQAEVAELWKPGVVDEEVAQLLKDEKR